MLQQSLSDAVAASPSSPSPSAVTTAAARPSGGGDDASPMPQPTQVRRLDVDSLRSLLEASGDAADDGAANILLVDLRSFLSFRKSHIASSINVSVPPALAMRPSFTLERLEDALSGCDRARFINHDGRDIVLVDANSSALDDSRLLSFVAGRLAAKGKARTVYWLEGGYDAYAERHPGGVLRGPSIGLTRDAAPFASMSTAASAAAQSPSPPMFPSPPSTLAPSAAAQPGTMSRILDALLIGDARSASDLALLRAAHVRFIVNVTAECPNVFESALPDEFVYLRVPLRDTPNQSCVLTTLLATFAFLDGALASGRAGGNAPCSRDCANATVFNSAVPPCSPLVTPADAAAAAADAANAANATATPPPCRQRVLVHCAAGRSRSVTIVIGYLMYRFGLSMDVAYRFVAARRRDICPNLGFMGLLLSFERALLAYPSVPLETEAAPRDREEARTIDAATAAARHTAGPARHTPPPPPTAAAAAMPLRPKMHRTYSSDAISAATARLHRAIMPKGALFKALSVPQSSSAAAVAAIGASSGTAAAVIAANETAGKTAATVGGCIRSRSLSNSQLRMMQWRPITAGAVDNNHN